MILSQKNLGIPQSLTLSIDAKAKKMLSEGYDDWLEQGNRIFLP